MSRRTRGAAQRFGAAPDRVAAVDRTLRRHGLTVGAPAANRLTIPVSGSAAATQRTFATSLARRARRPRIGRLAVGLDATDTHMSTVRYTVRLRLKK